MGGQPPPLRLLDSKSSLNPSQFPQPRSPYAGPRPRNVFYPRPPSLAGVPPGLQGSSQGIQGPTQGVQGFQGSPQNSQSPRFIQNPIIRGPPSQRLPFPGNNPQQPYYAKRNGGEQIRSSPDFGPNQRLQRNDSVTNLNPRFPVTADRRPQLVHQITIERMVDVERPKLNVVQTGLDDPKKLAKEGKENDDDDDDVVIDNESYKCEVPKALQNSQSGSPNHENSLDMQNNKINEPTPPSRQAFPALLSLVSPNLNTPENESLINIGQPSDSLNSTQESLTISSNLSAEAENSVNDESKDKTSLNSLDLLNKGSISPNNTKNTVDISSINKINNSKPQDDLPQNHEENIVKDQLSVVESPTIPKTPDSVKGFDNGHRRSLSSRSSLPGTKSPKTLELSELRNSNGEQGKTTFADEMDEKANERKNEEFIGFENALPKIESKQATPNTPNKNFLFGSNAPSKEKRALISARGNKAGSKSFS